MSSEKQVPVTAPLSPSSVSPLTEQEQQIHADYEWALRDPGVRRLHGGQVVAVHQSKVWGAGADHGAALKAALATPGCPQRQALALVVVPEETSDETGAEGAH
jgi:hypothetical protein